MGQKTVSKKEFLDLKKKVEELEENLSILTDENLLQEIMEARKRREEGKGIPLSEIQKDLSG